MNRLHDRVLLHADFGTRVGPKDMTAGPDPADFPPPVPDPLTRAALSDAVHPSSILRVRERGERHVAMESSVADLRTVADWISDR